MRLTSLRMTHTNGKVLVRERYFVKFNNPSRMKLSTCLYKYCESEGCVFVVFTVSENLYCNCLGTFRDTAQLLIKEIIKLTELFESMNDYDTSTVASSNSFCWTRTIIDQRQACTLPRAMHTVLSFVAY